MEVKLKNIFNKSDSFQCDVLFDDKAILKLVTYLDQLELRMQRQANIRLGPALASTRIQQCLLHEFASAQQIHHPENIVLY